MAGEEFVDSCLFLGMNGTDEAVRIACKSYFVQRLGGRVVMTLEEVGRCDDLVWGFPRAVQDAYYPFMDNLHTDMRIDRVGYEPADLECALANDELAGLPTRERLLMGTVLNRSATLRSVSRRLLERPVLPVSAPRHSVELSFPEPLEELYRTSLALRIPTEQL